MFGRKKNLPFHPLLSQDIGKCTYRNINSDLIIYKLLFAENLLVDCYFNAVPCHQREEMKVRVVIVMKI